MASDKSVVAIAIFAKTEASYGLGASLTGSTDGIQTEKHPTLAIEYAYPGTRAEPQGSYGKAKQIPPSGRSVKGAVPIEAKGLGASYSNTTKTVPNLHPFLLAAGLSGSLAAGAWTFAPIASTATAQSLALELYARGEKYAVSGAFCDMDITLTNGGPAVFNFPLMGIMPNTQQDTALPAWAATATSVLPPNSQNIQFALGTFTTARVRSAKFVMGRAIQARVDLNAVGGHAGFEPGARKCTFTCKIEAPAQSTFDLWAAEGNATAYALSLVIGSVSNNIITLNIPVAQITKAVTSEEGPVAMVDLTIEGTVSAPYNNDDFNIVFS